MERILEDILKELQYQTKLMEKLYEQKDEQEFNMRTFDMHDHIKNLILANPMVQKDPKTKEFVENMMEDLKK